MKDLERGLGTPSSRFWDPNRYPCQEPPWGYLTAIDLDTGEFRWRTVPGVVDELIARGLPPTGTSNIGGSMVTAGGLVFIGATDDRRFRAFDKDSGKELWTVKLPASAHATPMTFLGERTGKQFVVVAAGGGNKYNDNYSDALVAFSLPSSFGSNDGPAPFSHKQHAPLRLACETCHLTAKSGERAGFPAASQCMACHQTVAQSSPAIRRLAALGKDARPFPSGNAYQLADFVFFSHTEHTQGGVECSACHGAVLEHASPPVQPARLMSDCMDCHKTHDASLACHVCHELSQ